MRFRQYSSSRSRPQTFLATLLLLGFPLLSGCEAATDAADASIPLDPPESRGAEMLFDSEAMVEVLAAQNERNAEWLVARLSDPDAEVRSRSAFALASVHDPVAVPRLTELLDDPDPGVRRDAAFALGQLPQDDGGLALIRSLEREEDPSVRKQILGALGMQGREEVVAGLVEWRPAPEEGASFYLALSRLALREVSVEDPALIDRLIEGLGEESPAHREAAAYYFGRAVETGPWAERSNAVRDALDSYAADDPAAMHLLLGLGRLRDRSDAPIFMDWMARAGDWRIRVNAVRASGTSAMLETGGIREALWDRVESDPSAHVSLAAATALVSGFRIPDAVLDRARIFIDEDDERWRSHVPFVQEFAALGDTDAVLAWLDRHSDVPEALRYAPRMLRAHAVGTEDAIHFLARHDDPRVQTAAMEMLTDEWPAWVLEPAAEGRFFDLFEDHLVDGHPHTAKRAAQALRTPNFHAFGAVPLLMETYRARAERDDEMEIPVLSAILMALAEQGDPEARPLIEQELESPDHRIRRAASSAFRLLSGQEVRGLDLPDPEVEIDAEYLRGLGSAPRLIIETDRGTLRVRLAPSEAPVTVQAIARNAEKGLYDGVIFHRVIGNFVAQGGDFTGGDGSGRPLATIRTEVTQIPFTRGVIGMASAGKDTEGSQFFIAHSMQPHLDGNRAAGGEWQAYTAFGWLEEGGETLDALMEGDRVLRATLERDDFD